MKLRITVEGKAYEVDVDVLEDANSGYGGYSPPTPRAAPTPRPIEPAPVRPTPVPPGANGNVGNGGDRAVKAPIVGTVMQVKVKPGDNVELNQVLLVMEAMKMETNIASPMPGKVKSVLASPGDAVKAGQVLVELE